MNFPEWIEADKLPSTTKFLCPYCRNEVYYSHGSSSKSRKNSGIMKRCPYNYCPWCGRNVTPFRANYISE